MKLNIRDEETLQTNLEDGGTVDLSTGENDLRIWTRMLIEHNYANGTEAAVREVISNALDAQKENGDLRPIEITVPSEENRIWRVKDHGSGMSPEFFKNVFMKLGGSSKRDSEELIGAYGLGSKTPLIVSHQFIIETRVLNDDGLSCTEYIYVLKLRDGLIKVNKIVERSANKEEHGTTIVVGLKTEINVELFNKYIESRIKCIQEKFELIAQDVDSRRFISLMESSIYNSPAILEQPEFKIIKSDTYSFKDKLTIFIGDVPYTTLYNKEYIPEIGSDKVKNKLEAEYRIPTYTDLHIILKFSASDIELPNSREEIKKTQRNHLIIKNRLSKVFDVLTEHRAISVASAETLAEAVRRERGLLGGGLPFLWNGKMHCYSKHCPEYNSNSVYLGEKIDLGSWYGKKQGSVKKLESVSLEAFLTLERVVLCITKPTIKTLEKFQGEKAEKTLFARFEDRKSLFEARAGLAAILKVSSLKNLGGPQTILHVPKKSNGETRSRRAYIELTESGLYKVNTTGLRVIAPGLESLDPRSYTQIGLEIESKSLVEHGVYFTAHSQSQFHDLGRLSTLFNEFLGLKLYSATSLVFEDLTELSEWIPISQAFERCFSLALDWCEVETEEEKIDLLSQAIFCRRSEEFKGKLEAGVQILKGETKKYINKVLTLEEFPEIAVLENVISTFLDRHKSSLLQITWDLENKSLKKFTERHYEDFQMIKVFAGYQQLGNLIEKLWLSDLAILVDAVREGEIEVVKE